MAVMKIVFLSILISIGVKKAECHVQIYICDSLSLPGKSEREETSDWENEQKMAGSCGTDKYTVVLMENNYNYFWTLWMIFGGVNVRSTFFHDPIINQGDDQKSF